MSEDKLSVEERARMFEQITELFKRKIDIETKMVGLKLDLSEVERKIFLMVMNERKKSSELW